MCDVMGSRRGKIGPEFVLACLCFCVVIIRGTEDNMCHKRQNFVCDGRQRAGNVKRN